MREIISGRVVDEFNEPVSKVYVRAQKASYVQGERVFSVVMETQTNDLGEYRLFGLVPGRYYISALHPDGGTYMINHLLPISVELR